MIPRHVWKSLTFRKKFFKANDYDSRIIQLFHRRAQHLRLLPSYRISTPRLSLVDSITLLFSKKKKIVRIKKLYF